MKKSYTLFAFSLFLILSFSNNSFAGVCSDCPKKLRSCKGKAILDDGSSYEGEFRYGLPHGWGTQKWQDGAVYVGEFFESFRTGHGQQTFDNGDNFAGEWKGGFMHGKGVYTWVDGSKYVGTFFEGLMEGKGILTLANGESYDGEWKNGLSDGHGMYSAEDGSKHLGKYKAGMRHGSGTITWRTGDVFIGKWKEGKQHKSGTFQFNNGDKYMCIWENGEMTGEATYIFVNGREIQGDLKTIERETSNDEELIESISPNLSLTWYSIAVEQIRNKNYDAAIENLKIARQLTTPSSDLNKLIQQQMNKIRKEVLEGS